MNGRLIKIIILLYAEMDTPFHLFCCKISSDAQTAGHSILHIPAAQTVSTSAIANYIKQNFTIDREKVRAIYLWVSSNIKYDTDSANNINLGADPGAKITVALRRRKGVCENFAAIFNDICLKAGVTSFIVDGYTKQYGAVDKTGHSWCAVFIDNTWLLCDPTWDERTGDTKWLFVQPFDMIQSHMPFDPMWQLLDQTVSHQQFYTGNIYGGKNQPLFNYNDSIAAYTKMDSLQRFSATAYRIAQSGLDNNLIRNRHELTKMNIEMIRQDRDVELYNSAVADLNDATVVYNNFIQYRNKQFTPAVTDREMILLLDGVSKNFSDAHRKLDEIDRSVATFKFSTEELRNKLKSLADRVQLQDDFLNLYLSSSPSSRKSLFYTKQVVGK